jgi:hypothetical protein
MIEKMKRAETRQMPARTPQIVTRLKFLPHMMPGTITSWLPIAVAPNQRPIIRPAYFGGATLVTNEMPIGESRSSAKVRMRYVEMRVCSRWRST